MTLDTLLATGVPPPWIIKKIQEEQERKRREEQEERRIQIPVPEPRPNYDLPPDEESGRYGPVIIQL